MTGAWSEDPPTEDLTHWDGRSVDPPDDKRVALSIYAQLVSRALDGDASRARTAGEAFAELVRCRTRLEEGIVGRTAPGWASAAVADQLAYDVALISLARRHDIECSPLRFEHPRQERHRLERGLASRGVRFADFAAHDGLD
jgi:hypothetical protein